MAGPYHGIQPMVGSNGVGEAKLTHLGLCLAKVKTAARQTQLICVRNRLLLCVRYISIAH